MKTVHFDLIAIGGGSGGLAVVEQAARLGRKVAVIEARRMGGTCVNHGCVPKKIMWYAASLAQAVDEARDFGIPARRGRTDWRRLVAAREAYVTGINAYWDRHVEANGIERVAGWAQFVDARTVAVNGNHYTAQHIVIATGSRPMVPPVPGAELGITSDGFFELQEAPQRVAVVGGGYVAVELGGMLGALDSHVTLFAMEDRLLERFDPLLGAQLERGMRARGITVHTGFQVSALAAEAAGIAVCCADGRVQHGFDTVIWAVGRQPNTQHLNLDAAGLAVLPGGHIPVDDAQNTSVGGIYAIGDVTGRAPLTPVAIAAGRRLAERIFAGSPDSRVDYTSVPSVVFSHPPIASAGLSEPEARERHGADVSVYTREFVPMRHALSTHGSTTAMKLVCAGKEQRVVGIHVIGDNADEMLQGFAVALKMGATKADLDGTLAIHPTSAEELVTMKVADGAAGLQPGAESGPEWRQAG